MAPLRHLPDELLAQIVSYLLRPDLASVCRVSRRIHRITTRLLYNEAYLGASNESSIDLGLLIRTLLSPGGEILAPLVHHVHVAWSCEVMPLYHEDLRLFLAAAASAPCWGFVGCQLTECGQVILLLHLLPELHTLDVSPPAESDEFTDFIDTLCSPTQTPTPLPLGLRSLRAYNCFYEPFGCSAFASTLLTMLRLPQIKSITMPVHYGIYFSDADALLAATTFSPITHLKFPFARITQHELATILSAPRALTHFAFFPRSININYDFNLLRHAIAPLRASLTCLVLQFWTSQTRARHRGGASSTLGSLREWPVLRTLRCSLLPLLGLGLSGESRDIAAVLPECLRELEIFEDRVWTPDEALEEALVLVRCKRVRVPELRRLTVFSRRGGEALARERLRMACVEVGVLCLDYVVREGER